MFYTPHQPKKTETQESSNRDRDTSEIFQPSNQRDLTATTTTTTTTTRTTTTLKSSITMAAAATAAAKH